MISNDFLTMFMVDFFNFKVQSSGRFGENRFDDAFQKFTQMRQLKKNSGNQVCIIYSSASSFKQL